MKYDPEETTWSKKVQIVKSRVYRTGYRVEPWDMERLVQDLGGDDQVTRISVDLGDGSSLTVPNIGELARIPNAPSRPITGICIESAPPPFLATDEAPARLAILQLRDGGSFGLSYHVSGDERAVRELTQKIEDWVDTVTPWFGRLAYMDRPGLLIRGLLALGCAAMVSLGLSSTVQGLLPGLEMTGSGTIGFGSRMLAIACLVLLLAGTLVVSVRPDWLFPRAQIRFSEGETRGERSDRRRKRILRWSGAVVLLGVVGSVVSGLLS